MSCRFNSRGIMDCGGPTGICQRGVTYTTNIIFHLWFYLSLRILALPSSMVVGTWCRLDISEWNLCWTCWIYEIIFWSNLIYFGPLLLNLGSDHTCYTCFYHLSEVRMFLHFFRAMALTWYVLKYLSSYHPPPLVSMQSLKIRNDEVK